ncbi:hypothetical protein MASSI9I_20506 [Massilia sp. 9I]|nr:hypothetical protein MASSI9I_20506 [Massilia sp. 9I]
MGISDRINQKFPPESQKSTATSELFQLNNSVGDTQRVGSERNYACSLAARQALSNLSRHF